ncbi:MAG TPA: Ig domain-containing protein [Gemmata sp.]|jgi:hypothetical protein|nr:Ig domain-containing protein [Gemmata sp.]
MRPILFRSLPCLALFVLGFAIDAQEQNRLHAFETTFQQNPKEGLGVQDIFGRNIRTQGLTLVDWEGYIANPAIKIYLTPPKNIIFPAKAILATKEPRLHFDLPSATSEKGSRKEVVWKKNEKMAVYVTIFPDRDGENEKHQITIDFADASDHTEQIVLPVKVIDQDRERAEEFHITVDFSQDRTRFFEDEKKRATVIQAANDWAYFFSDMKLKSVPAGTERTPIWGPEGFKKTTTVTNSKEYTGFLLYAYGIRDEESDGRKIRSGGEPSREGGFQNSMGKSLPIRRSGGLEIEVQGNYNKLGWNNPLGERDWWQATNLGDMKNDLYSIAHHEMGHSLFFNPNNSMLKRNAVLQDDRIRDYLGSYPKVTRTDHLEGLIDPASLRGAFGNEYHGKMPLGRWMITKLDLLCAQAIGYKLRETTALMSLTIKTGDLPKGKKGAAYSAKLQALGGIPFYCWETVDELPAGLALNTFTGEISGSPKKAGEYEFTAKVRDYLEGSKGATQRLRIAIAE